VQAPAKFVGAYDAFLATQDKLGDWIDSVSMTKTA